MERIFNPRQFGALGDGITLDTKAIQAAIDEAGIAAERGAKTIVVLSKGIWNFEWKRGQFCWGQQMRVSIPLCTQE